MPTRSSITPDDIVKLAEACNELCVAVETYKLTPSLNQDDFAWKHLLQRKKEAWNVLEKFGN